MKNGVFYAVTAGLVGAGLWAAIAYYAEMELGLLAWGIGAAVGAAMMAGVKERAGSASGVAALVIALVSIVGGKYFAVELAFGDVDSEWEQEAERMANDEEYTISWLADDVILEYEEAGKPINYPPGADIDMPETKADYPADVWAEAEQRWAAMSPKEQEDFRADVLEEYKAFYDDFAGEIKTEGFLASFSLFDLLWFGLGGVSAYKLGAGLGG
jgi:phosphate/sulfate permease